MNIQNIRPGDKAVIPIVTKSESKKTILPFEIRFEELEVYEVDFNRNEVTLLKSFGDRHGLCKVIPEAVYFSKEDAVKATVHELEAYIFMLKISLENGETA
jgi:hypothetical protein